MRRDSIREGSTYLNDLSRIIRIYEGAIDSAIEHLEIPPVLVDRFASPLLPLRR
jgi:hypothetical protein